MGKHLQNPPDNIYAQFGDKLQRKREIGIHDSQKNSFFGRGSITITVRWQFWVCVGLVEAIQRGGGRGVKIDCPLLNLLSVTGMVNLINSGN